MRTTATDTVIMVANQNQKNFPVAREVDRVEKSPKFSQYYL